MKITHFGDVSFIQVLHTLAGPNEKILLLPFKQVFLLIKALVVSVVSFVVYSLYGISHITCWIVLLRGTSNTKLWHGLNLKTLCIAWAEKKTIYGFNLNNNNVKLLNKINVISLWWVPSPMSTFETHTTR